MCNKRKFSKLSAMICVANSEFTNKKYKGHTKRKECRFYYCEKCKSYHLTSKEEKDVE